MGHGYFFGWGFLKMRDSELRGHPILRYFIWLVVGTFFYFPFHIWNNGIPIDELIFFKMVIAPPTRF